MKFSRKRLRETFEINLQKDIPNWAFPAPSSPPPPSLTAKMAAMQMPSSEEENDTDNNNNNNNNEEEEEPEERPITMDGLGLNGEQQEDKEEEEPEEYYIPRPLKSRRKERKKLGKPGERSQCFLCAYVGERETALPNDDVNKIVEMLRQNTGRMDSSILAQSIADYYATFRTRINSSLQRGETPLPYMSASTVLEHIRKHHQDPEVKQIIMLEELQEIREELINVVFEKNNKTRTTRGNKVQIDCLEKIIKLELLVQSKDPAKMALYSAGARVNPTVHKQGAVAAATKNLYSYWNQVGNGRQ